METKTSISMPILNANCAGIDVGSRSHYVAVGQELSDVREFGVYAEDLANLCEWLKSQGIRSVAMVIELAEIWRVQELIGRICM